MCAGSLKDVGGRARWPAREGYGAANSRRLGDERRGKPCRAAVMCRSAVQQRPSQAGFVSNFRGSGASGWGGRDRTSEWRNQNPLPYRLATPQQATKGMAEEPATADSLMSQPVYRLGRGISTAWRGKNRKARRLPARHTIITPILALFRAGPVPQLRPPPFHENRAPNLSTGVSHDLPRADL